MAPLAATLAASVAVGVGFVLARSEHERRRARRLARDRRLGSRPGEALADGLRRVTLAQIDLALELLGAGDGAAAGDGGPPDEKAVHETRKAIKRLRALLRLLEHELGKRGFQREDAALREIARHLSGARDATVMLDMLDALLQRHPRKLARRRGVLALRRRMLAESERMQRLTLADASTRAEVLGELRAFRHRVAAWALPRDEGIALIDGDLARLYRQGQTRHRRLARGHGERTRAMHKWRKRVKDLRYAAEMLDRRDADGANGRGDSKGSHSSAGARKHLRDLAKRADDLGELLGEEHDLAVLAEHLRAGDGRADERLWRTGRRTRRALLKAIAARRRKLRKRALRMGGRLYAEKPKRFMRRVRAAHAGEE